ncbi:MAG: GNAT family N-acetyltransferase [Promethearchaeota archaeon]
MYGDQTDLSRDCLIAEDNKGDIIGFALLFKSSKQNTCWLEVKILPHYFKSEFYVKLFESALKLTSKQNTPKIRFVLRKYILIDSPLQNKLKELGLKPTHFDYWMRLDNFKFIPKIKTPKGYTFQNHKELNDFTNYVKILNDAFREHYDFIPFNEEEFKSIHIISWKGYFVEYWFAFKGNDKIGVCFVNINPDSKHIGIVYTLGVLHSYHHKGVGSYLLGLGIQTLIDKGCKIIELGVESDNAKALSLYEKFGFYEIKSRTAIFYEI